MEVAFLKGSLHWHPPGHWEELPVAVSVLSGSAEIRTEDAVCDVEACTLVVSSFSPLLSLCLEKAEAIIFQLPELEELQLKRDQPQVLDEVSAQILFDVFVENTRPLSHQEAALRLVCYQLAALNSCSPSEAPSHNLVDRALVFMEERLDESITLHDMAQHFSVTPGHIANIFKKRGYKSPMQTLARKRIDKAKVCLQQTGLTVTQIALAVGYRDLTSFSHFFKKHTGLSPSEYRENVNWLI